VYFLQEWPWHKHILRCPSLTVLKAILTTSIIVNALRYPSCPTTTPVLTRTPVPTRTPTPTPAPYLRVIYPNGGERLTRGRPVTFKWETRGAIGTSVKLLLLRGGVVHNSVIASNTGSFTCTIPSGVPSGVNYRFGVQSIAYPSLYDLSDRYFSIK
jgi:hypothetical protein